MKLAIKWDQAQVDEAGNVAGHSAGDTLVRRIMRLFPNSILIGAQMRPGQGFKVAPLEMLDPRETAVINMDVVDSPRLWQKMYNEGAANPKIMNFMWFPPSDVQEVPGVSSMALSCALFPTFANSERTAQEIREITQKWTVRQLHEQMRLGWVNLGFRLAHVQPRQESEIPVVLYPSIYLSARKRPEIFLDVVEYVHKQTPIKVEMRLHETHLVSEAAMKFSQRDWIWVGPLTATRQSYWQALSHTTAFLATTDQESYGITYVEALGAGAIGVFPDLDWARALVPPDYPFFYRTVEEARNMLWQAVVNPAEARRKLDACAGGNIQEWIGAHHSDDAFDEALVKAVTEWLGFIETS